MSESKILRPARVNPLLHHVRELRTSLDGQWSFQLDPEDIGVAQAWFNIPGRLAGNIIVPGSWQGQGFGDESNDRLWDFAIETRVYRATSKCSGWYGRVFTVPPAWDQKRIWLNFGGVHPSAQVWLNGSYLGENSLPFVPFAFDITGNIRRDAENHLVVRVHEKHREFGLAYSWQGNWSGLYRGVDLTATESNWLERCALLPDVESNELRLRLAVGGNAAEDGSAEPLRLAVTAVPIDASRPACHASFALPAHNMELALPVPDALLWSPECPNLYRVDIELWRGATLCDARSERTGFVTLQATGKQLRINGQPYYWRGSGDFISCPETGCPDTDRARWRRKLQTLRDYGYNYVRCQSFVYGPEYYDIADEVGLLVQSEMGMIGAWGGTSPQHVYQWPQPTPDNYPVLKEQWHLVVERDACHPSANIYCMSNECWDGNNYPRIAWECYHDTKAAKPGALVIWTDGGYNTDLPGDFVNQFVSNMKPEVLAAREVPFIQHEYRWWSSFPDVRLRARYTGAMRPYAADIAAEAAARNGQSHLLETYAVNSQHLQFIEAKAAMEAMRRDYPTLAGINHFNAMDINASPQGIINEFYEPKLVDAGTWRESNGDTVVLCSLGCADRCWQMDESVKVGFSVSDYSHPAFREPQLHWRLRCGEDVLAQGATAFAHVPFATAVAGEATIKVPISDNPVAAVLEATLSDGHSARAVHNQWPVWLFPNLVTPENAVMYGQANTPWLSRHQDIVVAPDLPSSAAKLVVIVEALSPEILEFMDLGGRVLLVAGEGLVRPHGPLLGPLTYFFTPPANYSPYEDGQNGTVVAAHAMLGALPHQGYADWQFFRMIEQAPPLDIASLGLAEGEPVVRVIHRYPVMHPLGYLVERRVGAGGLIVSALELDGAWVEARWLLNQLCDYAASAPFRDALPLGEAAATRLLTAGTISARGARSS